MGCSSAISSKLIKEIVERVERGVYPETSGCVSGIPVKTMQAWLTRGRKERDRLDKNSAAKPLKVEALYLEFLQGIDQATAKGEVSDLDLIRLAAESGVWQAAAWRLERRWPERYARKVVIAQEGRPDGEPTTWRQAVEAAKKDERQEARAAAKKSDKKAKA